MEKETVSRRRKADTMKEPLAPLMNPEDDPQIEMAERQIFALVRGLESEGFSRRILCCALCDVLFEVGLQAWEDNSSWGMRFFNEVAYMFFEAVDRVEKMAEAMIRNRAAGGNGTPYQ
jgi:hypothetical protein